MNISFFFINQVDIEEHSQEKPKAEISGIKILTNDLNTLRDGQKLNDEVQVNSL